MNAQTAFYLLTRELVPEARRMAVTGKYFGLHFPLQIEPTVYGITERMAKDYSGGYWDFYTLSNGGFYMAPSGNDVYHVSCNNQYQGTLSADALGITACLYAYLRTLLPGWYYWPDTAVNY